ncbi:hypothetical protein [Elizabethkingia meningoseptica]|uniref:hypothetical protein n=1 Tax=Elizabethkingia meningoseptica TaxID=238 RepID=UPI001629D30D|nr:hypothetical protein [Elizabethkingia meningoseptica]HAY3553791.1 hypothetical protein [Elizabethkingia meningoseptica]
MKRLEEIIFSHVGLEGILKHYGAYEDVKKCMDQYAREVAQASLNKAAENALIDGSEFSRCGCEIDEQSIVNPDNIVLL